MLFDIICKNLLLIKKIVGAFNFLVKGYFSMNSEFSKRDEDSFKRTKA